MDACLLIESENPRERNFWQNDSPSTLRRPLRTYTRVSILGEISLRKSEVFAVGLGCNNYVMLENVENLDYSHHFPLKKFRH